MLFIADAPITDAGLAHLEGLTNLRTLWLTCTEVTEAGVARLNKRLPKLTVNWGDLTDCHTLFVYRVVPDTKHYQSLVTNDRAFNTTFDGSYRSDGWQPPACSAGKRPLEEGDFWGCFRQGGAFAMTPEARDKVRRFFMEEVGEEGEDELLPLNDGKRRLLLWNVTCVVDCLDRKDSRPNKSGGYDPYVFDPELVECAGGFGSVRSLFKIPETRDSEVLVVEYASPVDEFKATVERYGLKGLRFEKLWRLEPGRKKR